MRFLAALICVMLAACGGSSPSPAPVVTISNPLAYLAQSVNPDGNVATPLGVADPWSYERFDFGDAPGQHFQAEQTFLDASGTGAATIWSYPPYGPFIAANGDGGEIYAVTNGAVYIDATQDGSSPTLTYFGTKWWLFDQYISACPTWEYSPDGMGRACHESVTFPATGVAGNQISVDTVISEHSDTAQWGGEIERFYLGLGWGRLGWEDYKSSCTPPADLNPSQRAPLIPAYDGAPPDYPDMIKCDERLATNVVAPPPDPSLSGAAFGWPPAGTAW